MFQWVQKCAHLSIIQCQLSSRPRATKFSSVTFTLFVQKYSRQLSHCTNRMRHPFACTFIYKLQQLCVQHSAGAGSMMRVNEAASQRPDLVWSRVTKPVFIVRLPFNQPVTSSPQLRSEHIMLLIFAFHPRCDVKRHQRKVRGYTWQRNAVFSSEMIWREGVPIRSSLTAS